MPRGPSIPWHKRVSVFLEYRRNGGKVLPIASRYEVARSTVRKFVKEFEDMGFSDRPRAKLAPEFLLEMQTRHIKNVLEHGGIGDLHLGPGNSDEDGRQSAMVNPVSLDEAFKWHIKGSRAEELVEQEVAAASDYLLRESDLWTSLKERLELLCGLEERDASIGEDPSPHLYPDLKRKLNWAFLERGFRHQPPALEWLEWGTAPDNQALLTLNQGPVAVGGEDDHDRVKHGIALFLADDFPRFQRQFVDIHRLRRDLVMMREIADETYRKIGEMEIREGICPECPYPEARVEPEADDEGDDPNKSRRRL